MHDLALTIALLATAGIACQWFAWRLHLPAIALLLIAGLIAGPFTGWFNPVEEFGDLYRPGIGLAVAIILFEGGLTLNFAQISETSTAVRRIIFPGGPMVLVLGFIAGITVGGLSWQTALILGSILVVTGPTVIMPLLRQARLKQRPATLLRWEAIVNDPIGALFAVLAFEYVMITQDVHEPEHLIWNIMLGAAIALPGAFALGRVVVWLFTRGHIPEFLKAPILVALALLAYSVANLALEEAGLLAVTVLGITLANSRIASLAELRRFKETITIILVSAVFIILTASLKMETLMGLGWEAVAFVFAILFIVRPLAIGMATIGTGLTWQERVLVGWIAPRGIVAVAVAGLFGSTLVSSGVADGDKMLAYTFAVVAGTIIMHGFSLPLLARLLDLRSANRPGVMFVGGSRWAAGFATELKKLNIPVLLADANWSRLRHARTLEIPTYFGDVLTEDAHHHIELNGYSYLIAATDNDSYNALVCTDFAPEIGRSNVFQIGDRKAERSSQDLHFTIGGRTLLEAGMDHWQLQQHIHSGWVFSTTELTTEFGLEDYKASRPDETETLLWITKAGELVFAKSPSVGEPQEGAKIISFGPPLERSKKRTATPSSLESPS